MSAIATGPAVVLTGNTLDIARQAIIVAQHARRRNGLPESATYATLLDAVTDALSRSRHHAVDEVPDPEELEVDGPDELTAREAADILRLSLRQTQRLAPRLGGRLRAGRWILDRLCVEEHVEGSSKTIE